MAAEVEALLSKLAPPFVRPPTRTTSVADAMMWCRHALHHAATLFGHPPDMDRLAATLTGRCLTTSSSFSGIGTPEIADEIIAATVNTMFSGLAKGATLEFMPVSTVEMSGKCQEELLCLPKPPKHVFTNILFFLPLHVQRACGLHGCLPLPNSELKTLILTCEPSLRAWCVKCGKHCTLTRADIHRAGSPCTDASSMGKMTYMDGPNAKVFFTWCALRRRLREPVVVHENVPKFGTHALEDALGDLYIICRDVFDPTAFGWPARRPRQICIMLLKSFICPAFVNISPSMSMAHHASDSLDFSNLVRFLFTRECGFTYEGFLVANDAEVEELRAWMRNRPAVIERRRLEGLPQTSTAEDRRFHDPEGSFLWCLTSKERSRQAFYSAKWPDDTADLNQNPDQRPLHSSNGKLNTLLHSMGLQWHHKSGRPLTPSELLTAMGLPISDEHVAACDGAMCQFSRSSPHPAPRRTIKSQVAACGNAMHINVMGAVTFVLILKLHNLGRRDTASLPMPSAPMPTSHIAAPAAPARAAEAPTPHRVPELKARASDTCSEASFSETFQRINAMSKRLRRTPSAA